MLEIVVAILVVGLLFYVEALKRRIDRLKRVRDYFLGLEITSFEKSNPEFIIIGKSAKDSDGFIQFFNSKGQKVLRLTTTKADEFNNIFVCIKSLKERGIPYRWEIYGWDKVPKFDDLLSSIEFSGSD